MKFEEKIEKIKEQLKKDPNNVILMNQLAIAYMEINENEEAFRIFKKAVKINPTIQALNNLAYFYLYEGEHLGEGWWRKKANKTINILKKILELNPKQHFPYSLLGEVYLRVNRPSDAEKVLRKAMNFQPIYANQNNLGVALYYMEKYEEASSWFLKAYLSNTYENDFFSSFLSYGVCLAKLGRYKEAEEVAETLLDKIKNIDQMELEIGPIDIADIYLTTYNYNKAINMFERSISTYTKELEWMQCYFYSLFQCDREKDSEVLLSNLIQENNELIIDIMNDSDWEENERKERVQDIQTEIIEYKQTFYKIKDGYIPEIIHNPIIKTDCYLYGCIRHNNPNYEES